MRRRDSLDHSVPPLSCTGRGRIANTPAFWLQNCSNTRFIFEIFLFRCSIKEVLTNLLMKIICITPTSDINKGFVFSFTAHYVPGNPWILSRSMWFRQEFPNKTMPVINNGRLPPIFQEIFQPCPE